MIFSSQLLCGGLVYVTMSDEVVDQMMHHCGIIGFGCLEQALTHGHCEKIQNIGVFAMKSVMMHDYILSGQVFAVTSCTYRALMSRFATLPCFTAQLADLPSDPQLFSASGKLATRVRL